MFRKFHLTAAAVLAAAFCFLPGQATGTLSTKTEGLGGLGSYRKLGLPLIEPPRREKSFSVTSDPAARFQLCYEEGLEKKEPAINTMLCIREAIGRVETRMGEFNKKFSVVVLEQIGEMKDPYTTIGVFHKEPAIFVTYNGTTTEVIAHGLAMLRIQELEIKVEAWRRVGGARLLTSSSGFDKMMYGFLEKGDGPLKYADCSKVIADKDASLAQKQQALAMGWLVMYYLTELSPKRHKMEEVLQMKISDFPDPEKIWKEVNQKGKKK